jgi:hypothetical protein
MKFIAGETETSAITMGYMSNSLHIAGIKQANAYEIKQ